jgi:hypothetical protein
MKEALDAIVEIIDDIPISDEQILNTAESIVKKIESDRITGSDIYWDRRANALRGIDKDIRAEIYQQYKQISYLLLQ